MPELVACPNCERRLKVPDTLLGKRVKCPGCQTTFVAAAEVPTRPPRSGPAPKPAAPKRHDDDDGPQQYDVATDPSLDDESTSKQGLLEQHFRQQRIEDERSKRGKRPFTDNWRKARLGIKLVSLASFILFANFIVILAGRGIIWIVTRPDDLEANPSPRQREEFAAREKAAEVEKQEKRRYLSSAVAIVYLVHHVVALIGLGICVLAPEKDNLRLLVLPALVLAVGSLGLEIANSVAPLQYLISGTFDAQTGTIAPPHPAMRIAADLVGYLRFFALLFFLYMIGRSTKTDELAREVLMLMVFMALMIVFWLVMAILVATRMPSEPSAGVGSIVIDGSLLGVMATISLALVLSSVVWFTMTLYTTTLAIADWLREKR